MEARKNLLDKASAESRTMDECLRMVVCAMLTKGYNRPKIDLEFGDGERNGVCWKGLSIHFHTQDRLDAYEYLIFDTFCTVSVKYGDDDREEHQDNKKATQLLDEFLRAHNYEL